MTSTHLINSRFEPAWWLPSCHAQTIFPARCRRIAPPPTQRERLITPDNDFIDIDWCGEEGKPLVILLHGLTGSSTSIYIKSLQHALLKAHYRSVALNFRGCSGESNRSYRCYHSGETGDLHFLYQTLRHREPYTPMAAVGFSLGGNVLLKWLGEYALDLFAAVAISVPFVLSDCANKLDKGFSKLYRHNLLNELKAYIANKQHHLKAIGCFEDAKKIEALGDLSSIASFWEYDGRVVAKLHGFKDAIDYYAQSSSRQYISKISVPTLLIQSSDDPFMTKDVIPTVDELSPSVFLEVTQKGGHVGFVSGRHPLKPVYWLDQRIPEFLNEKNISKI